MRNRLAEESSPYLRQHAENPVDWHPWGEAALAEAAERDVPILLSIGYAACHWCHVMAHESFEDEATAAYMNEHFVNIKVDREERPDIDAIYLEAAQAMSGHGGWPLTAFLTPAQVPFFAGTYFPPTPRPNMPSFMQLMRSITDLWQQNRPAIEERSTLVTQQLALSASLQTPDDPISELAPTTAVENLTTIYDAKLGGFGGAPKFPPHSVLEFLLGRSGEAAQVMAIDTLAKIAAGGIQDHLAGGFSRYSVDARWHVPHFEKMLYDNALLARSYLHAFLTTGEADHARTATQTLEWMLADLYSPGEGFASALDADSPDEHGQSEEGAFYAWEFDELKEVLAEATPNHVDQLLRYWGAIDHGEFDGKNVLFISAPEHRPQDTVLNAARDALLARRSQRTPPAIDDKRITAWNALAVAAFADASAVLGEQRYLEIAIDVAEFIERELATGDGCLLRSSAGGKAGGPGFLEDHAYCAAAYLTLYEASGDERWFARARKLAELTIKHFEDAELGGFFTVANDHEQLIVRRKDIEDNPIPSGNSAIALVLLRLAALTGEQRYRDSATRTLQMVQSMAGRIPLAFGHALQAIDFHIGPVREVAIVGSGPQRDALLRALRGEYRPRVVSAFGDADGETEVPLLKDRSAGGGALAYVCEGFVCDLPLSDPSELAERLAS